MSGFDALFGDPVQQATEQLRKANQESAAKAKQKQRDTAAIPQMRSTTVNGVKYLRAEDVVEALRVTDSAVRVRLHIAKWLGR